MLDLDHLRIGIVGLGYVGLPLAAEFGKHFPTLGFDINDARIRELQAGCDSTLEVDRTTLQQAEQLHYSSDLRELAECNSIL